MPTLYSAENAARDFSWNRMPMNYYRGHRHHLHDDSSGPHLGGLIAGVLIIVVGLGIFFPELPWQVFWASLLILLGSWILFFWFRRNSGHALQQPTNLTQ